MERNFLDVVKRFLRIPKRRLLENNRNSTTCSHFKVNCYIKIHNANLKVRIVNFGTRSAVCGINSCSADTFYLKVSNGYGNIGFNNDKFAKLRHHML